MKNLSCRNALGACAVMVSAMTLVACGGGDDPAPSSGSSSGGGGSGLTITPTSNSANSASGTITGTSFIDTSGGSSYATPTVTFASSAVTGSAVATVSGSPSYGGMTVGSTLTATGTFNANSYTTLKIQLKSSTDTSIRVRLQPGTTDNTGCLPSKAITVTSTLTEYTIPLNSTNFTQAFSCTYATGSDFTSIKGAMGQIEVINEALTGGTHDVTVGTIKFQ